jgi:hypothetical protein
MKRPHRRLPRAKRQVIHPSLSPELLAHRARASARPTGAVTAGEVEACVLRALGECFEGRHLDIDVARLGVSNAAAALIVLHLREVAKGGVG